jgi:hypothetical protein
MILLAEVGWPEAAITIVSIIAGCAMVYILIRYDDS